MAPSEKLIPDDFVRLKDFAEEHNLPLSETTLWRISQNPTFPTAYLITPRTKLYSKKSLAAWFNGCGEILQTRRG
ncbi:hypothetical protein SAMN02745165_01899 [Malonomonas rubra DSM 5091]|uniref:DNA-binding protein n=1 Tax=Malonomonas rubra DSM 5091 TaxID=1122189 RepID=A0A1M6HNP9_MALRU|nr:hypothetical protein [Malonomonas rubra]SHJ23764.1 hypothetical protein SAMN02745165_01899 [Malonomonas rubra DSM 5091]